MNEFEKLINHESLKIDINHLSSKMKNKLLFCPKCKCKLTGSCFDCNGKILLLLVCHKCKIALSIKN